MHESNPKAPRMMLKETQWKGEKEPKKQLGVTEDTWVRGVNMVVTCRDTGRGVASP